MTIDDSKPDQAANLRQRAETAFRDNIAQSPEDIKAATPEETQRMLHELRVHQIELEMQNEELRRAQVELDTARARYFDLYDLAPVGYVTVGEAGLILEANLTAATLLGVSRGNLVTLPFSRFIHKEDQDNYYLHRKQLLETGAPHAFELRMAKKDGTTFWARLEATVAHNRASWPGQNGELRPVLSIVISNINDHKQLEDTRAFLLQCGHPVSGEGFFEALARHLVQVLGMGYVCIDRLEGDGLTARTLAIFNDGLFETNVTYALKDTPCGDVVGKTICCFPRDVTALFPRDAALLDLKAESYIGTTLWSHDGKPIGLIAVIGRAPLANRGLAESIMKLVAIRAAGELERQQAVEILQESEQRFRSLFEQSNDAIFIHDDQGHMLDVNPRAVEMLGYTRDELIVLPTVGYHTPEAVEAAIAAFKELIRVGHVRFDSKFKKKDGSVIDVELSVRKTGSNTPLFQAIVHDITKRIKAEEALRREKNLAALGVLAGGIAHDFNNLLQALIGSIAMAQFKTPKTSEIRNFLDIAAKAGADAAVLADKLIAFAPGGISTRTTIRPADLVREAVAAALSGSDIRAVFDLPDGLPNVHIATDQVRRAVESIALNAVEAMPSGGVLLVVATPETLGVDEITGLAPGGYVRITIRDQGPGIAPEILPKIFDPYYSLKQRGSVKGMGLGLTISDAIIKKHGGAITVESNPGDGTTVHIHLPAAVQDGG